MSEKFPKWLVIALTAIIALILGFLVIALTRSKPAPPPVPLAEKAVKQNPERKVIGRSVQNREIEAYTYGGGSTSAIKKLLFVGGIHGGYEWNSVLLAYELMDYLKENLDTIPANLEVTVIPSANPDGVFRVVGKEGRFSLADVPTGGDQSVGRFNAHGVDLNRNFDCNWSPTGVWKGKSVGTGSVAFSEPESKALRNYILANRPDAVVMYHSAADAVYASQCRKGILPETTKIMNTYAKGTGYKAVPVFDSYVVNGASEDWLASENIPAITVELKTHQTLEWERNLRGVKALFELYGGEKQRLLKLEGAVE